MSRISDLYIEIQEEIERGQLCFRDIAAKFNVPFEWVDSVFADVLEQYRLEESDYPWNENND